MKEMLNAFDQIIDAPFFRASASAFPSRMRSPHDLVEDTDAYRLRIDMPGFSKEEVKLTVEGDQLVINGEQNADKSDDGWSSHSYENYNTRLTLPEHVKVDEVKAELKNGMLRIVIPKFKEDPKTNAIPIEVH
jgi:HSP20 family protein